MRLFSLTGRRSTVLLSVLLAIFLWPSIAFSQKNSFTNYSIEDGLMQSQVTKIAQDSTHRLIIATLLGVNLFDGKTFSPITKDTAAADNTLAVMAVDHRGSMVVDHKGKIWCSGIRGVYWFYGDNAKKFVSSTGDAALYIGQLVADKDDNIWGTKGQRLLRISGKHLDTIRITGPADSVTAINVNEKGEILAAVRNKGIFCFENNSWTEIAPLALPQTDNFVRQFTVQPDGKGLFYLLTESNAIYSWNETLKRVNINFQQDGVSNIYCIVKDNMNGLWVGTSKGAYYINNDKIKYFNESNGFTNSVINDIFKDFDNNIWLGSDGQGIFRFNGDSFVIFDQSSGLSLPVLQFAADKNGSILMPLLDRLMSCDGAKITQLKFPSTGSPNGKIHGMYTDDEKNVWIGTEAQLWKKNGTNFTLVYPKSKNDQPMSFFGILKDSNKTLWVATSLGCYYWDNGFVKVPGVDSYCTNLLQIGRDSMLVSSGKGIILLIDKKIDRSFKAPHLIENDVMSMKYHKGRIFAGTFDRGLFIWKPGGPITNLDDKNGLSSNSAYSVDIDSNDVMWVGTGRALNQFKINEDGSFKKIINENISSLVIECNQAAILFNNNKVWVATTKGVFVFKNDTQSKPINAPYTTMQDVLFYDKQPVDYTYKNGYKQPVNLKLPYDDSHITLSFNGIYLKDPKGVSYSYKLSPLDAKFISPVKNNVVDYPSLPPGNYVFYVKTYSSSGVASNTASFAFEVTPAYYQTATFKIAVFVLALLLAILIWRYARAQDERKRKMINNLRLEEQVKIRKQTAEDFHDDLGNKLTRINVLSDILYKKINEESVEERKLIYQIKENADALFTGSKHILWALDPDNDRLSEVLVHIKEFGIDLFLNSAISFTSDLTDDIFKEITLPMGYGRNITLIFKELFNNALRHSEAKNVKAEAFINGDNEIYVTVEDDGKGFDMDTIKSGNGMRNINNRAKKMNGAIKTRSSVNGGTSVTFSVKLSPHLHQ